MLILVVLIVTAQFATLSSIRWQAWAAMSLLLLMCLAIGWFSGGRDRAARKSMAVTTACRNIAVGLVIASRNFPGTPAVVAVVAYGLFCILGTLGFAVFIGRRSLKTIST